MTVNYVIWNNKTMLPKVIEAEDFSVQELNKLYRFYSEHKGYNIERIDL